MNYHALSIADIEKSFNTNLHYGLTGQEVKTRTERYGLNKLKSKKAESKLIIFVRQFKNPLVYILLFATAIIFLMQKFTDGIVILSVLLFNAIVGAFQESKVQNTLLALNDFTKTSATVIRDGQETIIDDQYLVPGDIIILQDGEKLPADARVIESNALRVDEAVLTGESSPVHKISDMLEQQDLPTADQKNMVFKGTYVVGGNGKAMVVATGLDSMIGKISQTIAGKDVEIPLKIKLRYLSKLILIIALSLILLFLLIEVISNVRSFSDIILMAISLAVAVIPEGLPVVLTLILTRGVWRMAKQNVLVKSLPAVEALGQVQVIAVDKTGTLTKNEMCIRKVFIGSDIFNVGGVGYKSQGEIRLELENGKEAEVINPPNYQSLILAGKIAAFCANARVSYFSNTDTFKISGDPTEAALLVLGAKVGFNKSSLEKEFPEVGEIAFDYKTKYHTTFHQVQDGKIFVTVVGAPEPIFAMASKVWSKDGVELFTQDKKNYVNSMLQRISEDGLRMVAFAFYEYSSASKGKQLVIDSNEIIFGGLYGMEDALRPEVYRAMKSATSAGIKVVMITGDHQVTAVAIAKKAGIFSDSSSILSGHEIDMLTKDELDGRIATITVFARVTPEHKMKIIESYRRCGKIIAMTGDGVNDVPSLIAADVGVSMGKIGTEVAKESADIVLLDDNFGSIVVGVEEGRSTYKTIKKIILYLFATNLAEILIIVLALILRIPLPLAAVQILWINLMTDGLLDAALAMEKNEDKILLEKVEKPSKWLVDKLMLQRMLWMSLPMAIGTLYLFSVFYPGNLTKGLTMSMVTLSVFVWLNAWNCRSSDKSLLELNPFSNKYLIGATLTVVFLQVMAINMPFMQKLLHTTSLSLYEWLMAITIAASVIAAEETRKLVSRYTSA